MQRALPVPSVRHELPLQLIRDQPRMLAALLARAFELELEDDLVEGSASFAELEPATYAADLVLVGRRTVIVVEVQSRRHHGKRWSWPLYAASAHRAHRRATWLVVLTLDEKTARWAQKPIATFHGGSFTPWVVGPAQIPRVDDLDVARRSPELAVLSALAHGPGRDPVPVALAALIASSDIGQRDEDRGKIYWDAVMASVNDVARSALEAIMKTQGYEYQSEFARKYVAQGREEGREEGREGIRRAIRSVCAALDIPWSAEHTAELARMDLPELDALLTTLTRDGLWPA